MSERTVHAALFALIEDDQELYRRLCEAGFIPEREESLAPEHLELARVAHTLSSELEVNWAGVEIVLRMRRELLATRRQMFDLLQLVREEHGRSR
jgi:hypothetical protein